MTRNNFDEELRQAFHTLSDRLRNEIAEQLNAVADELSATVESERASAAAMAAQAAAEHARASAETVEQARGALKTAELAASERLVDAIRTIDRARSLSEILDTLVSCAGREVARVGIFLVQGATLRGWRFIGFDASFDAAASVQLPVAEAGVIADAVRSGVAVSSDGGATAPAFAKLPQGREMVAVPVPISGQVVAVLYADQAVDGPLERMSWPATLEVFARHAARSLEAITAFRAAQIVSQRADDRRAAPAGQSDRDDEEGARRYARLLVSEIKLYHEPDVIAGRLERDLMTRLGGEIVRARVLYEQRVPASARCGADYFNEELVRTLADGDATLIEVRS